MCYSARVRQNLHHLSRQYGAEVAWEAFEDVFKSRLEDTDVKVDRGLEQSFAHPTSEIQQRTKAYIDEFNSKRVAEWETEVFRQRRRLGQAEESLKVKETKRALEDVRIATKKISTLLERLNDMKRTEPNEEDARIFPLVYAPIIVQGRSGRMIRPMRYACRLDGKPADYDQRFPGTYNARRDSLSGFWKDVYGRRHAVMVIDGFFENVPKHLYEHRELRPGERTENVVLQFEAKTRADMLVACLWDRWRGTDGSELYSFAAITDEPPQEVAATGHQRCVISIRQENMQEWLSPSGVSQERLQAILEDKEAPFYEHRIAA